jgi:hypothetical protein
MVGTITTNVHNGRRWSSNMAFSAKKNYVVKAQNAIRLFCNGCFFKFGVEVGIELSIVNALHRLRITDQLFKSYVFTRVVRSQSTLQRLLRRQI